MPIFDADKVSYKFYYLATPYAIYPYGQEAAYKLACVNAAVLTLDKIAVYSPIAHSYGLSKHGSLKGTDLSLWNIINEPMMHASHGIIVLQAEGWQESKGIKYELEFFILQHKPIYYMTINQTPAELKHQARIYA